MSFLADLSIVNPSPNFSVQVMDKSPLASLYTTKYDLAQMIYPRDLASNPARQHVVRFTTLVPNPNGKNAITPEVITNAVASLGNLVTDTANIGKDVASNVLQSKNPADVARLPGSKEDYSNIGGFLEKFASVAVDRMPKETIALYIPDTVNVQYGMNYSDVSLTDTLGKPYFYAQAGASVFDNYKELKDLSISQLASKAANDPYVRSIIANQLRGRAGLGDVGPLTLNAIGQAFNPQLQVLFTSVGFRSFQFDFTLTPYSQEEAKAIRDIVKCFKYRASPEIVPNNMFTQGMFQKVPDQFMIEFLYNGKTNENVHKIGTCVLTNIAIDYAPMGWATFGDGNPVQTKLTLQFQEIEIIDKTKINKGY